MFRQKIAWVLMPLVLASMLSEAQGGWGRRGRHASPWIQTPFGRFQNPVMTPEWRQAGGNPLVYQQLMQRKLMMSQQKALTQQYQMMQKQQQAFEKWYKEQKARKDKGQSTDPAFDELLREQQAAEAAQEKREAQIKARREAVLGHP